jgi:hypothetical protein
LYPYYTVRADNFINPFNSLLSVVNTTNSVKAVKVRFVEGKNSAEVLDFNLFLSPFDVWTAAIIPDAGGGGKITTADRSCTIPAIPSAGVAFVNFQYSGSNADGVPADASCPDLDRVGREHLRSLRRRPFRERFDGRLDVRMRLAALADVLRAADYVTVSAAPLLRIARRYNSNCRVIPDVIAPEFLALCKQHSEHEPVIIGWTGYKDNSMFLESLEPVLERLAGRHAFELRVLTSVRRHSFYRGTCDNREIVAGYRFPARFVEWRLDNAWSELFACDIGVAPVPPGIVKSANKAATYMAIGLPAVASRTEEYSRAIEHGETGFLCSTAREWEQALERLISSVQERARVGAQGRAAVEQMFSMKSVARQWWEVIS